MLNLVRTVMHCSVLLIGGFITDCLAQEAKESREPAEIFYLETNGKKIPIALNQPFSIGSIAANPTATLRVESYRVFRHAGLEFEYPREFTFQADCKKEIFWAWTLSGSGCTIIVQDYPGDIHPNELQRRIVFDLLRRGKIVKQGDPVTLQLGERKVTGIRLTFDIAGAKFHQDLYTFHGVAGAIALIIQDAVAEDDKPTPEWLRVDKMLRETLKLPPQSK